MRLALCFVFGIVIANAQTVCNLELRESRQIVGTLVDQHQTPVGEAVILRLPEKSEIARTGADGQFRFDSDAPAHVIKKDGYRSEIVCASPARRQVVSMRRLPNPLVAAFCESGKGYVGDTGTWGAILRFRAHPRVAENEVGPDADYVMHLYHVRGAERAAAIVHGVGATWSLGVPSAMDTGNSIFYEETHQDSGGFYVNDAHGMLKNGKRWRYVGIVGESAAYSGADEETARIFDEFLDGLCLRLKR